MAADLVQLVGQGRDAGGRASVGAGQHAGADLDDDGVGGGGNFLANEIGHGPRPRSRHVRQGGTDQSHHNVRVPGGEQTAGSACGPDLPRFRGDSRWLSKRDSPTEASSARFATSLPGIIIVE